VNEGFSVIKVKLSKNMFSREVDINDVIKIFPDINTVNIQKCLFVIEGIIEVKKR